MRLHPILVATTVLAGASGCGKSVPPPEQPQAAPDEDTVRLSDAALSRNEIRVADVTTRALGDEVEAPAEVRLAPDRLAHVTPLVAGQLQRVEGAIGARVAAGQTLAVLRSVELGQARAELQRAAAMLEVAQTNFEREKRLRAEGISSERSFLEAQLRQKEAQAELDAARARLLVFGQGGGSGPDLPLLAPIAGTITEGHATTGENVGPDHVLFVIADTAKVWAVAHVYERDMGKVRAGSGAHLTLQGHPGQAWEGKVGYVAPLLDEQTRTLEARVELDNREGLLRPGLFGRLRVDVGDPRQVVAIPEGAVQTLRGAQVVFVPGAEPNSFRAQKVETGARTGELVEIRRGLEAGGRVVVAGAFLLKSQLLASELGEAD